MHTTLKRSLAGAFGSKFQLKLDGDKIGSVAMVFCDGIAGSQPGKALQAHELTHVVQQSRSNGGKTALTLVLSPNAQAGAGSQTPQQILQKLKTGIGRELEINSGSQGVIGKIAEVDANGQSFEEIKVTYTQVRQTN